MKNVQLNVMTLERDLLICSRERDQNKVISKISAQYIETCR